MTCAARLLSLPVKKPKPRFCFLAFTEYPPEEDEDAKGSSSSEGDKFERSTSSTLDDQPPPG